MRINKTIFFILIYYFSILSNINASTFLDWKENFKIYATSRGVSESTINRVMKDAKFLPKVIEYDRYQPEFYEDTITYINKRSSNKKIKIGKKYYEKNKEVINNIDKDFKVEKELLLALMGIETNFGKYLGKMDIISSLSTLSYDKRRSEFFTNELITLLKLIDNNIVDPSILYGSWAGAFGNFQFMPSTIENYAIDYNNNNLIELKNNQDSFASAANYLNKLGWKKNSPCFKQVTLNSQVPKKYLNTSAQKIKNKKKLKFFKKYIENDLNFDDNLRVAIITPDADIVKDYKDNYPSYIVFDNYELILKWNRSLRFGLAVCTLKNKFKNEF
tara:strand:- start:1052 stop:2044 length:993 start_codon:yes stop_codon:yes gene_type:complete